MRKADFIRTIYAGLKPGMTVVKPRKLSEILRITEQGGIYYRVGKRNEKAVTTAELEKVYDELAADRLSTAMLYDICPSSKPCNATTIKWILCEFGLAQEDSDGIWKRTW